jgi:hypothetical protein
MNARWAFAALTALFACPAQAQTVAITNATLVVGDGGEPVRGGTVLVQGGKVIAAGTSVTVPAGVRTIDAGGKWVTPGLVVAVTDLGLVDVGMVDSSNDGDAAKSPFSAALDIAPAINPASQHIAVSRAGGITRAAVAPLATGSIFGGQGAVIDLGADPQAVMVPRAFQYLELGETAAARAGGSRAAVLANLRNAGRRARRRAPRRCAPHARRCCRAYSSGVRPSAALRPRRARRRYPLGAEPEARISGAEAGDRWR